MPKHAQKLVSEHGVKVTLPGFHQAVVYTDSDADAEVIAGMVRSRGCVTEPLFDLSATRTNRTWSE